MTPSRAAHPSSVLDRPASTATGTTESNVIRGPWGEDPRPEPTLPLVYCAGPYSTPYPPHNIHRAIQVGNQVWDTGLMAPFVPHLTGFWDIVTPRPEGDWLALDRIVLLRCDAVYRYDIDRPSSGARGEVIDAGEAGIPVWFDFGALLQWAKERHG